MAYGKQICNWDATTMTNTDQSSSQSLTLNFRGKPRIDAKTGDVLFIAYMGLRFILCRVKRSALRPFAAGSVPSEEEILAAFSDQRKRIERIVGKQVLAGTSSPVVSDLNEVP
jgi:hypothetical protein